MFNWTVGTGIESMIYESRSRYWDFRQPRWHNMAEWKVVLSTSPIAKSNGAETHGRSAQSTLSVLAFSNVRYITTRIIHTHTHAHTTIIFSACPRGRVFSRESLGLFFLSRSMMFMYIGIVGKIRDKHNTCVYVNMNYAWARRVSLLYT